MQTSIGSSRINAHGQGDLAANCINQGGEPLSKQTEKLIAKKAKKARESLDKRIAAANYNPESKLFKTKQRNLWNIARSFTDEDFVRLGKKGNISEKQLTQCFKFRCNERDIKYQATECKEQISDLMERGEQALKKFRERLGIAPDDEADTSLATTLINNTQKALSNCSGYLYFKCWKVSSKDYWFKIGITNDLKRRDVEQNVLPVKAETIAYTKFNSMEEAGAAEKAFHSCLKKYKVKGASNRELFNLPPSKVAAIIAAMKALKK